MKKFLFIINFIVFFAYSIVAQEFVLPVGSNYDKTKITNFEQTQLRNNDTLELPFMDDFSTSFPLPNSELWASSTTANITQSIAYRPPSIGVATFDALDQDNFFHSGSYSSVHLADILTSKPINLNYEGNQSIYLSFYYQAQGIADYPETADSLILQFYSPETEKWETVWRVEGPNQNNNQPDFNQIMINISEERFLKKGFQFRFFNKASLSSPNVPSLVANCDQWHVDYVYLNKDRNVNDLLIKEVAFQKPLILKIDNYQTVPYAHLINIATKNDYSVSYEVKFRNNDNKLRDIDSMYIVLNEKNGFIENDTIFLGSASFPQSSNYTRDGEIDFLFPEINEALLNYELKTVLVTDNYDSTFNNIIYQNKTIGGNYAYDDGTAEAGYGLVGEGTIHALVANKFTTYMEDTLTAVEILFNPTFRQEQPQYFFLMVWAEDEETGMPGDLIYEKQGCYVDFDAYNQFHTYTIDSAFAVSGNFFVGWKKTNEQFMNVGLDLNTTDENHKFYNLNGYWVESQVAGELLVQPVFGKSNHIGINELSLEKDAKIYPNPTTEILSFELINFSNSTNFFFEIYDLQGKKVFEQNFYEKNGSLNLQNLQNGIYFLKIFDENGNFTNKKIIKQ